MDSVRAIKGGIIGACVGVVAWILAGMFFSGSCSWMALVAGALTGFAVNRMSTAEYKPLSYGGLAAMLALIAILAGKYMAFAGEMRAARNQIASFQPGEEELIACVASKLSAEIESQGQSSQRLVVDGEYPNKSQFAPAVWRVAEGMWKSLGDAEKQLFHNDARAEHASILGLPQEIVSGSANKVAFTRFPSSFGFLDFLCIPLGLAIAFFLAKRDGGRSMEASSTIDRLHRSMDAARARESFSQRSSGGSLAASEPDDDFKKDIGNQIAELRAEAQAAASGQPMPTIQSREQRKRRPPVRRTITRNRE